MHFALSSASNLLPCVDLDGRLTFSEGSSAGATSRGALLIDSSVGKSLRDVWPDNKIQNSVRLMHEMDAPATVFSG